MQALEAMETWFRGKIVSLFGWRVSHYMCGCSSFECQKEAALGYLLCIFQSNYILHIFEFWRIREYWTLRTCMRMFSFYTKTVRSKIWRKKEMFPPLYYTTLNSVPNSLLKFSWRANMANFNTDLYSLCLIKMPYKNKNLRNDMSF